MQTHRRAFGLNITAAVLGASQVMSAQDSAAQPKSGQASQPYFFKHPTFEYIFQMSLGRAYYLGGNPGKILYLTRQVEDGNFESAFQAFVRAGDEARAMAEESASEGHKESAKQAYLWAQNFYDSATYFADGSKDPSRFLPTWELLYDCWLKGIALFDPPIEPVKIPYENTELHGFFFRNTGESKKRPLLIINNGSDGSLLDMWVMGAAGALARGYNCLTFDGPGQGYALWKQKLYFRPDWEKVITPLVDYALSRPEVDPKRIAVQGISQGGYWIPRALAFENRVAAAIADPGVVDVSTSWVANLPQPMRELLRAGRKAEFDGYISKSSPADLATLRFRMRPFGFTSPYDTFKASQDYNLKDVAGRIRCPMLITAPQNESFWPGQSQKLFDMVTSPKQLIPFTASDGADLHCEPQGFGLRDLRVFNWLDRTLQIG
jgi:hypothetical protein